ncbi:3-deoxy-8-phosphooctulonate synthase [Bacteroidota bacterium]
MIVKVGDIQIGGNNPIVLIAGPCVVENREITLRTAGEIKNIASKLNIPFIFKSSYKKANRTSLDSFTTIGIEKALDILYEIKSELEIPLLTDIHSEHEVTIASNIVDILQIPAFLCRQTDLLLAAGKSEKIVNIKKGQFLAPEDMIHVAKKVNSTGNNNILFTERGTMFGYHNLIVDMRSLVIMKEYGYPVIMDATHSVQIPSLGNISGGLPKFISPLAKAATAIGIDGLFLEVHPDPPNAFSDAASQLPLSKLEELLNYIIKIDNTVKEK